MPVPAPHGREAAPFAGSPFHFQKLPQSPRQRLVATEEASNQGTSAIHRTKQDNLGAEEQGGSRAVRPPDLKQTL